MSLSQRSISAVFWGAGGALLRIVLQIGAQVVLARLLGPAEYGLFAVGAVIVSFCMFFADFGLAYGLIQKREVVDEDIRFAWTWQLIVGGLVAAVIASLSGFIAQFFHEPRIERIVAAMSLICLATAASGTSMNLLKRDLDFKRQQIAQLLSYATGFFGLGIPMALLGFGVWALVWAWVSQSVIFAVIMYLSTRHAIRPLFWYPQARTQLTYGVTVLRTNVLNWYAGNVDRILIGRLQPIREIGLYSTIYNMIYGPSASLLSIVQPVFFSASTRVAEAGDAESGRRLASGFTALIALTCLYLLPVFAVASVLADEVVLTLYGPEWSDAAAVLRPLALAMPFFIGFGLSTPMLWANGRPQDEFRRQLPVAIGWTLLCFGLVKLGGIQAASWGVLGLFMTRFAVVMHGVAKISTVPWSRVWQSARGGVTVSTVTAVGAVIANMLLKALGLAATSRLAGSCIASGLVFYLCLRSAPVLVSPDVVGVMSGVLGRLPAAWASRLAWMRGAGARAND